MAASDAKAPKTPPVSAAAATASAAAPAKAQWVGSSVILNTTETGRGVVANRDVPKYRVVFAEHSVVSATPLDRDRVLKVGPARVLAEKLVTKRGGREPAIKWLADKKMTVVRPLPPLPDGEVEDASIEAIAAILQAYMLECSNLFIPREGTGQALYPNCAVFNHSCDPNCVLVGLPSVAVIMTLRAVTKGEQLTLSYIPYLDCVTQFAYNRVALRSLLNGPCKCATVKCVERPRGDVFEALAMAYDTRSYEDCVAEAAWRFKNAPGSTSADDMMFVASSILVDEYKNTSDTKLNAAFGNACMEAAACSDGLAFLCFSQWAFKYSTDKKQKEAARALVKSWTSDNPELMVCLKAWPSFCAP